jgi:hypothetical protein
VRSPWGTLVTSVREATRPAEIVDVGHARIVNPTSEWFGHGFEKHPFEIYVLSLEDALALRSCWVPCPRFADYETDPKWKEREAGSNGVDVPALADVFDVSKPISIIACSKAIMDLIRYGRCPSDCAADDLIAFDGNHRLAALGLRRSRGLRDEIRINAYICTPATG